MSVKKIKLMLDLLARLYFKQVSVLSEKASFSHEEYFSLESILNALLTGKNKFFIGDECEVNHILDCFCDHLGIENTSVRRFVLDGAKFYFVSHDDFKKPLFGGLAGDVYYAIPQQPSDIEAYLIDSLSCHTRYYVTKYQGSHNK
ncbi:MULTISPECIES: hypothetical protein [Proteus]|uniref:hypothetical protein n=1 Tax=Proteus TaxID=583 RepID=UPI000D694C0A|nr:MULTISPECIES: hypothetical protein [Proteus]MBI6405473.1 hypothetical protein [Proteus sp. PR00208]